MTHWLDMVITLLQANTSDLRELARLAGADPKTFYQGIEIERLDLLGKISKEWNFRRLPRPTFQLERSLSLIWSLGVQKDIFCTEFEARIVRKNVRQ
jgi:hypothetical protein